MNRPLNMLAKHFIAKNIANESFPQSIERLKELDKSEEQVSKDKGSSDFDIMLAAFLQAMSTGEGLEALLKLFKNSPLADRFKSQIAALEDKIQKEQRAQYAVIADSIQHNKAEIEKEKFDNDQESFVDLAEYLVEEVALEILDLIVEHEKNISSEHNGLDALAANEQAVLEKAHEVIGPENIQGLNNLLKDKKEIKLEVMTEIISLLAKNNVDINKDVKVCIAGLCFHHKIKAQTFVATLAEEGPAVGMIRSK